MRRKFRFSFSYGVVIVTVAVDVSTGLFLSWSVVVPFGGGGGAGAATPGARWTGVVVVDAVIADVAVAFDFAGGARRSLFGKEGE